jgi:hypothetical protein
VFTFLLLHVYDSHFLKNQRGNQKPWSKEPTMPRLNDNGRKDKQWSPKKTTQKTKDWVTPKIAEERTQLLNSSSLYKEQTKVTFDPLLNICVHYKWRWWSIGNFSVLVVILRFASGVVGFSEKYLFIILSFFLKY